MFSLKKITLCRTCVNAPCLQSLSRWVVLRGYRSRPAVVIQTRSGFRLCFFGAEQQARWRGQRWEPEPSRNRWRQSHIAIIWTGRSVFGDQSAAALLKLFPMRLVKCKGKKTSRNCRTQNQTLRSCFIREPSQCNFIRLISKVESNILQSLELWRGLSSIYLALSLDSQLSAATVFLPIIRPTNSSPNSQPSVLNPLPAVSGHVSLF